MARLGAKLRSLQDGQVAFRCPGCRNSHALTIAEGKSPRWNWDGNADRPTFTPSIFVKTIRGDLTQAESDAYDLAVSSSGGSDSVVNDPRFRYWCHSFVTDGRIQFLDDCSHALAGQTVDLPDLPE